MAVAAAEATRRKKRRIAAFDVVNVVIMLLFAVSIIYPFYFCILIAFNDGLDSLIPGMYLWPRKPTLDNFRFIFMSGNFALSFANSVARTVVGTVLHITVTFTASGIREWNASDHTERFTWEQWDCCIISREVIVLTFHQPMLVLLPYTQESESTVVQALNAFGKQDTIYKV